MSAATVTVSDEAVEAFAAAFWVDETPDELRAAMNDTDRDEIRVALAAAAPHILRAEEEWADPLIRASRETAIADAVAAERERIAAAIDAACPGCEADADLTCEYEHAARIARNGGAA